MIFNYLQSLPRVRMRSSLFLTCVWLSFKKIFSKKFGYWKNGVILNQVERQTKQANRQTKNSIKKQIKNETEKPKREKSETLF